MIKGAKTIAEYAIRKWLETNNFAVECFDLVVDGNTAILTDSRGETMRLIYDPGTRAVRPEED